MIALHDDYKGDDASKNTPVRSKARKLKRALLKSSALNSGALNTSALNSRALNLDAPNSETSKHSTLKATVLAVRATTRYVLHTSSHKLQQALAVRQERKLEKLALERLLQLDDNLLKDMGIERRDLEAVKSGSLTLDALNKHGIVAARDIGSNTTFIWK